MLLTELIESPILGGRIECSIYLPPGFPGDIEGYPTLYLLHGRGDNRQAWTRVAPDLDELIDRGELAETIVVMPDAPWACGAHWYVDSLYVERGLVGRNVETAMTTDLVSGIDARYRTLPRREARAVGGYSMGGFGALRFALAHQTKFGAALAISPTAYVPLPPQSSSSRCCGAFGIGPSRFVESRYRELNYAALLSHLDPELPLYVHLAVGSRDTYVDPGEPDQGMALTSVAATAYDELARADGICVDPLDVVDGGHGWDTWRPAFTEGMRLLARHWPGDMDAPNQRR